MPKNTHKRGDAGRHGGGQGFLAVVGEEHPIHEHHHGSRGRADDQRISDFPYFLNTGLAGQGTIKPTIKPIHFNRKSFLLFLFA